MSFLDCTLGRSVKSCLIQSVAGYRDVILVDGSMEQMLQFV